MISKDFLREKNINMALTEELKSISKEIDDHIIKMSIVSNKAKPLQYDFAGTLTRQKKGLP